jgi:hypothetical protein
MVMKLFPSALSYPAIREVPPALTLPQARLFLNKKEGIASPKNFFSV